LSEERKHIRESHLIHKVGNYFKKSEEVEMMEMMLGESGANPKVPVFRAGAGEAEK